MGEGEWSAVGVQIQPLWELQTTNLAVPCGHLVHARPSDAKPIDFAHREQFIPTTCISAILRRTACHITGLGTSRTDHQQGAAEGKLQHLRPIAYRPAPKFTTCYILSSVKRQ